eukprot:93567-Pelagomonas_calceolata.AAC.1
MHGRATDYPLLLYSQLNCSAPHAYSTMHDNASNEPLLFCPHSRLLCTPLALKCVQHEAWRAQHRRECTCTTASGQAKQRGDCAHLRECAHTMIDPCFTASAAQQGVHTHLDGIHLAVHGVQAKFDLAERASPQALNHDVLVDASGTCAASMSYAHLDFAIRPVAPRS